MRQGFTQNRAFMKVTTPFGNDTLLLDAMEATEAISELFRVTLHMRSGETALEASKIIGSSVTVTLQVEDGPTRHFNGIASRFIHAGGDHAFAYYSAELVPKLWLLTLSRDRAIWQAKTIPEIVKAVLEDFGITYRDKTSGSYKPLDYCVQYDESAFDFISRLMESAGIFYYFTFANGIHTLVLADASTAHVDCTDGASVRFFPENGSRHPIDTITRFELEDRLVVNKQTLSDFDPINPSTSLRAEAVGTNGRGASFDWPGGHLTVSAGQALAKLRLQAAQIDSRVLRGDSYAYPFTAGTKFTISGHVRRALNTNHVLRRVQHTVQDNLYRNSFEAFPATVPFRAPLVTPRPRVAGSQTATVVGPKGEEIWTDKHGRIKLKFHWDRVGKKDDTCSAWVRVSQPAAGAGIGALFIPRVGQEVVVSCIDGDPDRPLVTGSVYNGENVPPVTLPANQTQSVIKTKSSKQGKAGNEIRLEDKKGSEEFYLHAQKDMKVEIENGLTVRLTEGAETLTLEKGDRTIELKTGKEVHKVKGTRALTITGDETHTNEAGFRQEVKGDYTLKVTGNLTLDIKGNISIKSAKSVTLKAGTSYMAEAGTALTNKAGTSLTNHAGTDLANKAGLGLTNQAGTTLENKGATISSKASAMQTVDGGGMLTLKGGLAKIN